MSSGQRIGNILLYQGAWFAAVFGAAYGHPSLGLAAALAAVAVHLVTAPRPERELALIGIAVATGLLFETLLVASGWVRMPPGSLFAQVTPLWMVALWAAFATTLNVGLRSLRHRYGLCALLAGIGAPLAYHAGARLGALEWIDALPALAAIALGWAVAMPLLMRSAQRFDGFSAP